MEVVQRYLQNIRRLEDEVHEILAPYEGATRARIVHLDQTYHDLGRLSLKQDDLMRQALRCVENELFRAAHVMAWAAFMDFLEEKLESDGLVKLKSVRPSWKGDSMAEMREYVGEYQLVDVCQPLGLCTKNETKAFHSLLSRRNECAHPSSYFPRMNETLGYIAELLQRMAPLISKTL